MRGYLVFVNGELAKKTSQEMKVSMTSSKKQKSAVPKIVAKTGPKYVFKTGELRIGAKASSTGSMTSSRKQQSAAPALKIARTFKHRGKQITITLIDPVVASDGSSFQLSAAMWQIDNDFSKLTGPIPVKGIYAPATYQIDGFGFLMTITTDLNTEQPRDIHAVVIKSITMTDNGTKQPKDLVLPFERLRLYALQLAGLHGTAYPPNHKEYFADGKSYFDSGETGGITNDRYGYRMTRTTALLWLGEDDRPRRDTRDDLLVEVAKAYKRYKAPGPHGIHHGIYDYIAKDLGIGIRQARYLVAQCRKPEVGLLEPTGRKRAKKKTQAKKRGAK